MTGSGARSTGAARGLLVAGGRYHDFDFARLELLRALAAKDTARVKVASTYADLSALEDARFLVTYTCDIAPDTEGTARIDAFLRRGGRWLALHGTNSILAQNDSGRWFAPPDTTGFMALLGSQFAAHPPIAPYEVRVVRTDDPLTAGLADFTVEGGDELYYLRIFGPADVLLDARSQGPAKGFVERDWPDSRHPVLYRKAVGDGEIVFFSLGHRRGRYDMAPLIDEYPAVEKGAWEVPVYREILRRCLDWAVGA